MAENRPDERALPDHLVQVALKHKRAGARVAIVVRHAERHPVDDLSKHEEVLLTERGHRQAREAGARLRGLEGALRLHHSPVDRCRETAEGIAAGFGEAARVLGRDEDLGAPFVVDRQKAFALVMERGPRFIREWFDGTLPAGAFMPRREAARQQLQAIERTLEDSGVSLCVTHDWNIALLKEDLLALAPERGWPAYLDGLVVARDRVGTLVEIDGRVARL